MYFAVGVLTAAAACSSAALAGEKRPPKYTSEQITELCRKLSSNDDETRWKAAEKLIEAGAQSTNMLCGILQGEWLEGRKLAAYLLGETKDPAAVIPLASCLGDEEFHVRWKCAVTLKNIGKPSVEALSQVLRTGNLHARHCAAWALGEVKDPRATLALAEAATADDHHLRWKSVISLKRIGSPAVEQLKKLLRSDSVKARRCAVWALDQIGVEAEKAGAVGALLGSTKDADDEVRQRVAKALARYERPEVRAALEGMIEDVNPAVRRQAVKSIATLGQVVDGEGDEGPGYDRVPRWKAFEVVQQPDVPVPDPEGAAMEVKFLTPSHASLTVGGFYAGGNVWKARIAPDETGEWFYKMAFTAGGKETVQHGMFTCEASELPGGLCLRRASRPYLEAGGKPFQLVEAPLPDEGLPQSIDAWRLLLEACGRQGFNLLRLDLALFFDGAERLEAAKLIDEIIAWGHEKGVYFVLTLFDEEHVRDEAFWRRSRFNADNGGPIQTKDRFPMFYDPISPEVTRMQEEYIRSVLARTGGYANVIFELCRNFNMGGSAVPFARGWLKRRLELFRYCRRPVMLSAVGDAEELYMLDGIDIASVNYGQALKDRLPAVRAECPADAAGAVSAAWRAMVGCGGFASWTRAPVKTIEESIRFVSQAENRAWVLAEYASNEDLYALRPDPSVVLSSPPGIKVAAQVAGKRALLYLAGSAAGDEVVKIGMPSGEYSVEWLDVRTREYRKPQEGEQDQGVIELKCPRFTGGIAAEVEVK